MSENNIQFVTRAFTTDDTNFVLSYLLKSYVVAPLKVTTRPHCVLRVDRNYLVAYFHDMVMNLLVSHPERITLAVATDDPTHLLGFSIGSPGVLLYIFIKELYRNNGIGKALLEQYLSAGKPRYLALGFISSAGRQLLEHSAIMYSEMTYSQFNTWIK